MNGRKLKLRKYWLTGKIQIKKTLLSSSLKMGSQKKLKRLKLTTKRSDPRRVKVEFDVLSFFHLNSGKVFDGSVTHQSTPLIVRTAFEATALKTHYKESLL